MVIWGTQNIRTGGRQLRAGEINSIAYGRNRDETGITTIHHIIILVGESNRIKTKAELQVQTGKDINDQEYQEIIRAVQHNLETKEQV